jgi:plasmid replication initiation protein
MSELVAYKSNALIESSYRLTLQEQRLMLLCISKSNPFRDFAKQQVITAKEFLDTFPVEKKNVERDLLLAVDHLWERSIILKNGTERREFRWIQERAVYVTGESKVEITFSDAVIPYLSQLKSQFTKVTLRNVSNLTSIHSIRLYELLQQYKSIGERSFELIDFKRLMGIEHAYEAVRLLTQWVLKPAIKELNEKSDLSITVQPIKQGRKITGFIFRF